MKNTKKCAAAWALSALWMGVIFAMSAAPGDVSGEQSGMLTQIMLSMLRLLPGGLEERIAPDMLELLVRKGGHMAEYAVLFGLYRRAMRLSGARRPGIAALAMCAAYAGTDEFHQSFVDGRGPAVTDVGIDIAGACAAWALIGMKESMQLVRKNQKDALR